MSSPHFAAFVGQLPVSPTRRDKTPAAPPEAMPRGRRAGRLADRPAHQVAAERGRTGRDERHRAGSSASWNWEGAPRSSSPYIRISTGVQGASTVPCQLRALQLLGLPHQAGFELPVNGEGKCSPNSVGVLDWYELPRDLPGRPPAAGVTSPGGASGSTDPPPGGRGGTASRCVALPKTPSAGSMTRMWRGRFESGDSVPAEPAECATKD